MAIADHARAAVAGMGVDSAFLAVAAHAARIGGVHIFAYHAAVVVKGVGCRQGVLPGFPLLCVRRLARRHDRSPRPRRVGVGRLRALHKRAVFHPVFGYAYEPVAAEGIRRLVYGALVRVKQHHRDRLVRRIGDPRLLAVRICHPRELAARIGIQIVKLLVKR